MHKYRVPISKTTVKRKQNSHLKNPMLLAMLMAMWDTYFEHSSKAWQSVCWNVHTSSKFPNKDVNSTVLRLKNIYMQLQWRELGDNLSYLSLVWLGDSLLERKQFLYFNFCFWIDTNSVVLSNFLKLLSLVSFSITRRMILKKMSVYKVH